ncbi:AraC family transcriptional regulator [Paenibacillus pasadenensis]|nr:MULTISPECIES: AraC family transcriptional regulator [Paenibacillus]QGG56328.1 helix-turn-helix domain-containing protein [Paenibacillus sp. B01]
MKDGIRLRERNPLDPLFPAKVYVNRAEDTAPGQNILFLHWHEHFELIAMRRGKAVFHLNSEPFEAEPGTVLLVQAGDLHAGYSRFGGAAEYVSVVFSGALLRDWSGDPGYAELLQPYLDGQGRLHPLGASGETELAERVIADIAAGTAGGRLLARTGLLLLLARAAAAQPAPAPARPREAQLRQERFKQLLRHVEASCADKHTIEDAAARVRMDPFHFCKVFKKLTGSTYIDYVNQVRMQEAMRLLRQEDCSVAEAAERVGCGNANYFTKLFKRYNGMTPSEAKKLGPGGGQP